MIRSLVVLATLVFSTTVYAQVPNIPTLSKEQSLALGSVAFFPCQVKYLGTNQSVIWEHVDHNVTLSMGWGLLNFPWKQKYSITSPQDASDQWNLVVYNLEHSDAGIYRCYVLGYKNMVSVNHILHVTGAPTPPTYQEVDVTACCIDQGVETCALPMCRTITPFVQIVAMASNSTCMANNLLKVLWCGQDGRNHMPCCMRIGLSTKCQNLCDGWGTNDGTSYTECIPSAMSLIQCLKEGQSRLPSQPTSVSAVATGANILVSWLPPLENPNLVINYKVQFKKSEEPYYKFVIVSNVTNFELLQYLETTTLYEIQVIAVSQFGASQPSYGVQMATRTDAFDMYNKTVSVRECCSTKQISNECLDFCDPANLDLGGINMDADKLYTCYGDVQDAYSCLMGGGNHTPCCARMNVPSKCYPMCAGQFVFTFELTVCLYNLPLIAACVEEGAVFLPAPPVNTRIIDSSVTSVEATVAWDNPSSYVPTWSYIVDWKRQADISNNWNSVKVKAGTRYQLTGLQPNTLYDVRVYTVNDKGASLPELTLMLVTQGIQSDPKPYNETECCNTKGVPSSCLKICTHDFRLKPLDQIFTEAYLCTSYFDEMLHCGTDGRDHTECCRRRGISDACLKLCAMTAAVEVTYDFVSCMLYKDTLSTCFEEGRVVLPQSPKGLYIVKAEPLSITLQWKTPSGPAVTSYTVQYAVGTLKEYNTVTWSQVTMINSTFSIINKLEANTSYIIRVLSVNSAGTSLPSNAVTGYTKPSPLSDSSEPDWDKVWQNRTECCRNQKMDAECIDACVRGEIPTTAKCGQDFHLFLMCAADGRNHGPCCHMVPEFPSGACLSLCQGGSVFPDGQLALCRAHLNTIMTCFSDGQGKLPPPPEAFRVTDYTSDSATLAWAVPSSNCGANSTCMYTAMILDDTNEMTRIEVNASLTHTFSGLEPESVYRLSVMATNKYGESLPAPFTRVVTRQSVGLYVSQYPPGVINQGQSVTLTCIGTGTEDPLEWERNKRLASNTSSYTIDNVTPDDNGEYICKETSDGLDITKSLFLNVKFTPKPVAISTTHKALPGLKHEARLFCQYKGFPSLIAWTRDNHQPLTESRFNIQPHIYNFTDGITTSYLEIRDVVLDDFGIYTCNGSNEFGFALITETFENDYPYGSQVPPGNATSPTHVSDCCKARKVPEDCRQSVCSYAIDLAALVADPNLSHCVTYFEDYIVCGADGKDHTSCCTKEGISDFCLPLCRGLVPQHDDIRKMLVCIQDFKPIIECAINAIQYAPTAPQNASAQVIEDSVLVSWQYPDRNPHKVNTFVVHYTLNGKPEYKPQTVGKLLTEVKLYLPDIKTSDNYTGWVVAENDWGTSLPSNNFTVVVLRLVPPKPVNIRATVLGTNISLIWDQPRTRLNITKYNVFYKEPSDEMSTMVPATNNFAMLIGLKPGTSYTVQVAALSMDGLGTMSDSIVIKSQGNEGTVSSQQSQSSEVRTGMAVGLVLAALLIIVIAVVVIIFVRRSLKSKNGTISTVAFENPQYAQEGTVTGLPGDDSEDSNQFGYTNLREDTMVDRPYVTMQPASTPVAQAFGNGTYTNSPATLNLED
ncbi:Ig-like and fibronectin type-III domain-containing protein 2 [Dreissena polymorpha]|uniref:Ig-like and fibronectin type-III domain-containing protein 2 n=1 Tax=Dreissena polymorpha TaxID=45954 RepID=UPI002264F64F|nr:Ig-like and fibronectin type-III domain-containing protein 2 [Dreissena polymorpha]